MTISLLVEVVVAQGGSNLGVEAEGDQGKIGLLQVKIYMPQMKAPK